MRRFYLLLYRLPTDVHLAVKKSTTNTIRTTNKFFELLALTLQLGRLLWSDEMVWSVITRGELWENGKRGSACWP